MFFYSGPFIFLLIETRKNNTKPDQIRPENNTKIRTFLRKRPRKANKHENLEKAHKIPAQNDRKENNLRNKKMKRFK